MLGLQDLLVDKLCRQDYTLVADVLHLSCFEHAAAGRNRDKLSYFVGFNEHVLKAKAADVFDGNLVITMGDGTRTSRMIEKAVHPVTGRPYLIGASFPADVRHWPEGAEGGQGMHPMAQDVKQVHEYISRTRSTGQLSHVQRGCDSNLHTALRLLSVALTVTLTLTVELTMAGDPH